MSSFNFDFCFLLVVLPSSPPSSSFLFITIVVFSPSLFFTSVSLHPLSPGRAIEDRCQDSTSRINGRPQAGTRRTGLQSQATRFTGHGCHGDVRRCRTALASRTSKGLSASQTYYPDPSLKRTCRPASCRFVLGMVQSFEPFWPLRGSFSFLFVSCFFCVWASGGR